MKSICPAPPLPCRGGGGAEVYVRHVEQDANTPPLPSSLSLSRGRKKEIYGVQAFVLGRGWLAVRTPAFLPSLMLRVSSKAPSAAIMHFITS